MSKGYNLITKKGNTYQIDHENYDKIMQSIAEGKMFVMVGETPVAVSNIAEIPKAKYFPGEVIDSGHRIEAPKVKFDPEAPGYKSFLKMREELIKKKGIR